MFGSGRDDPVTVATAPAAARAGTRRRSHTTYRRADLGSELFRPGGPTDRRAPATSHRVRPTRAGCVDVRGAARAAAVRRRHVLLAILALGLLAALASPWSGRGTGDLTATAAAPARATLSAHTVYVVQPGDTLWSIAERLAPRSDPRPTVTTLSEQVGGDTVRPGERLILP